MPLPERPEPHGKSGLVHGGQSFGKGLVKRLSGALKPPLTSRFATYGFRRRAARVRPVRAGQRPDRPGCWRRDGRPARDHVESGDEPRTRRDQHDPRRPAPRRRARPGRVGGHGRTGTGIPVRRARPDLRRRAAAARRDRRHPERGRHHHPADPRDLDQGAARSRPPWTPSPRPGWRSRWPAQGGIGILHRNLSIEDQAYQVDLVKRTQTGMISNPVTIGPDATLEELDEICGRVPRLRACRSSTTTTTCSASSPTATCASPRSPSGPPPWSTRS